MRAPPLYPLCQQQILRNTATSETPAGISEEAPTETPESPPMTIICKETLGGGDRCGRAGPVLG